MICMRVITGSARGRNLKTLDGLETRPTSQKTKEALFSVIQFDIEGRRVLDLFAGSGQLGIEALSRSGKRRLCGQLQKGGFDNKGKYRPYRLWQKLVGFLPGMEDICRLLP